MSSLTLAQKMVQVSIPLDFLAYLLIEMFFLEKLFLK